MPFNPEPSDVLLTLAEVAVAFAGFASIVAVFQVRWTRNEMPFDLFRFWVMLAFSLATLLFALPLGVLLSGCLLAINFCGFGEAGQRWPDGAWRRRLRGLRLATCTACCSPNSGPQSSRLRYPSPCGVHRLRCRRSQLSAESVGRLRRDFGDVGCHRRDR